jgi:hypothetical protein
LLIDHFSGARRIRSTENQYDQNMSFKQFGHLGLLLVVLSLLPGCNALNPLCGSSRPVPVLNSISPATVVLSQLPPSFVLTATGSQFVATSLVLLNGAAVATSVDSSSQATATINSSIFSAPGTFKVAVQTPEGNSGSLGCSSGGTSGVRVLTVN